MDFKQVKPFPAFCTGTKLTVEKINLQSVYDNLVDHVKFKYTLADDSGATAGDGIVELKGESYGTWDATDRGAYKIVCDTLGLELVSGNLFKTAE